MKHAVLEVSDSRRLFEFYSYLTTPVTEFYQPFREITAEVFRSHLLETVSGKHISFGLEDNGEIVGHAFLMHIDEKHPVFGIGLAELYHGRGLGRKLMEKVLAEAQRREVGHITLTVLKHNSRALTLYRSFGFVMAAEHTFKRKNDSYFMIREPVHP